MWNSSYIMPISFFKQKTSYEMRISDWSSDVCSSDLTAVHGVRAGRFTALYLLMNSFKMRTGIVLRDKTQTRRTFFVVPPRVPIIGHTVNHGVIDQIG